MINTLLLLVIAATSGSALLVTPGAVADHSGFLPVDARPADAFTAGHLPGAAYLDTESLSENRDGVKGLLRPIPEVRAQLARQGIDPRRHIAIYAGLETSADLYRATRLFWILEYLGYKHVSIIDGGYRKWAAEGRPVEVGESHASAIPVSQIVRLKIKTKKIATMSGVQTNITRSRANLFDLRSPGQFTGPKKSGAVARAGHLATAHNVPATTLISLQDGTFLPIADISVRFAAETNPGKPAITYCNTGRSATVGYFALRLLGNKNVALYDGSMSEWTHDPGRPVETTKAHEPK